MSALYVTTLISAAEWKAVVNDWYVGGTINEPHQRWPMAVVDAGARGDGLF